MPTSSRKRSRTRRASESAYGVMLLGRNIAVALIALLLVVAGAWTSWDNAEHAMFPKDGNKGTMKVEKCAERRCAGSFVASAGGSAPEDVTVSESASRRVGETLSVSLKPGTDEVVRTGPGGILHSWIPLGGALALAALLLAGGLGLRRTGWGLGLIGVGIMVGAFFAL